MSKRRKHHRRHTNPHGTKPRAIERRETDPREPAPREPAPREPAPRTAERRTARSRPSRLRRELSPFLGPVAVMVVYAVVRLVYIELSDSDGVLTPNGSVDGALAALALATFLLRMLTLIVVPFVVIYRLVVRILGPRARRPAELGARER